MEPCNFSLLSLSEKNERDLSISERKNGWWVAYGSTRKFDRFACFCGCNCKISNIWHQRTRFFTL